MVGFKWHRNEQSRRAELYGHARVETDLHGKKAKKKRKKRNASSQKIDDAAGRNTGGKMGARNEKRQVQPKKRKRPPLGLMGAAAERWKAEHPDGNLMVGRIRLIKGEMDALPASRPRRRRGTTGAASPPQRTR